MRRPHPITRVGHSHFDEECDEQEVFNHRLGARDGSWSGPRSRDSSGSGVRVAGGRNRLRDVVHGGSTKSFEIAINIHALDDE
jgi:hypothetical protein